MNKLVDSYNRIHNYLRISLTDSCNFRCIYCMPNEKMQCLPYGKLMSPEEIFSIAKTFTNYQINKIRLTGGEPLVRRDFEEIVKRLSTLPVELNLTTNGVLLHKYADLLKEIGLHTVNISIDSLQEEKFKFLTKRNAFSQVWDNILLFVNRGFQVKLNTVLMKNVNDDEIKDFISLTKNFPIQVRFIEFMPFNGNQWEKNKVITMDEMLDEIDSHFIYEKIQDHNHDTTKKFKVKGYEGTFAFITTMSQPFCQGCNRMRITADGKMKNCLFGKDEFDILGTLRKGEDIEPLIQSFLKNKHKKMGGQFENFVKLNPEYLKNRSMIKIGG
ncbi:GTP 3',8-cyclase MoaA [Apibacter mensalis]|uniref:GTP 3',8-cyclase MoaA n=1 Tax=Apibacter mensalis TaxID=1586267 RepID=UPI0026EFAFAD|nr:GTP 3',8-cyclase MoaA [Apibacter mensalis]